ncbi:MAG TPA: hypothetical protein VES42_02160 [Pilimelia sp.]|nr:hypothetical protein [Pilimelia sp.]
MPGDDPAVTDLRSVLDHLLRRSVWIVGAGRPAYDIGPPASTTSWPPAVTSMCSSWTPKKDLAARAIAYGNVYVARAAIGADRNRR